MEEHTTLAFRRIAKRFGASLVITEMGRPDRIAEGDRAALRRLATHASERPVAGQVLAGEIEDTVEAARRIESLGFDIVDVNLSCPTRRLVERGWGGAYLREPARAERLLARVVAAVSVPVTIKLRSGWDEGSVNAPEIARAAEAAGVAAAVVHGRSVVQAYRGPADWSVVLRAKEAVRIPIVGGGSIRTAEDVVRMFRETGCDGVSVARGALGNPWIFAEARALLTGSPRPPPPSREERLRVLLEHLEAEARSLGLRRVTPRLLRLALYYAKELPDRAAIEASARSARNLDELVRRLREAFRK